MKKMSLFSLVTLAATVSFATPDFAEAARHCSKGKPCGNSCISRDDVCHIGQGSAEEENEMIDSRDSGREKARRTRSARRGSLWNRSRSDDRANDRAAAREERSAAREERDDSMSVRTRSSSAEQAPAKVCKRGKACGNSCIPASAVCHQ